MIWFEGLTLPKRIGNGKNQPAPCLYLRALADSRGKAFTKINLKNLYPDIYKTDCFVEVNAEMPKFIQAYCQVLAAYERRHHRYQAHYSLDSDDGIEHSALVRPITPAEALEQKHLQERLYAAVMSLSPAQARRIYARFYLGMTVPEIAQAEQVGCSRVSASIRRGLKQLGEQLEKDEHFN